MYVDRGKNLYKVTCGTTEFWNYYKNNYNTNIDKNKFNNVLRDFNLMVLDAMINKNYEFKIPCRLGELSITKTKIKIKFDENDNIIRSRNIVNWGETQKMWTEDYPNKTIKEIAEIKDKKYIYYINEHTSGYKHRFHWCKFRAKFKNQAFYAFKINKQNRTKIAKALRDNGGNLEFYLK